MSLSIPERQPRIACRVRTEHRRVALTRRGRAVVWVVATVGALAVPAAVGLPAAGVARAAHSGPPPASVYRNLTRVVVRPGDSLWTIASRAQPNADPRIVIQQIVDLNALPGTAIQPGERLWVPKA